MKTVINPERKSTLYLEDIRRHARVQLLTNREEYLKEDGTIDDKKLSNNIRGILGLYGPGWEGHSKYYQVEFYMIYPAIDRVKKDLNIK